MLTPVATTDKSTEEDILSPTPNKVHQGISLLFSTTHQRHYDKNTATASVESATHHGAVQEKLPANLSKNIPASTTSNPSKNTPASTTSNPRKNMPEVTVSTPSKIKPGSTAKKSKSPVLFKSNKVINQALLDFLGPHEAKRAPQRVVLIPNPNSKSRGRWLAYHPNNPEVKFKPKGYYAYTTKLDETNPEHPEGKKIVAWSIKGHNDTFHIGLSGFSETLGYAGEVLFSTPKPGHLIHFDSASGTYNPDEKNKEQAGFPVEKYRKPDFPF